MSLHKIMRMVLILLLSISVLLNIVLATRFFSQKPFEYDDSATTLFFRKGYERPEYDTSVLDNSLSASFFAQNIWMEIYGNKKVKPYSPAEEETFDAFYLRKLDCWVISTEQTVGAFDMSPYAIFDPDKTLVFTFLSPIELFGQ